MKEHGLFDEKAAAVRFGSILGPLFDPLEYKDVEAIFQLACCLVRADGMQDTEWDPIEESDALVADLSLISNQELDPSRFLNPQRTRRRLQLLAYCHLTEADYFYHLLANLLRIRSGDKYAIDPFRHRWTVQKKKKAGVTGEVRRPPSVNAKIAELELLSEKTGVGVSLLIREFYFAAIRNSVFHADYNLTDSEFRMGHGLHLQTGNYHSPVSKVSELDRIMQTSMVFYSVVASLHRDARRWFFEAFQDVALPYDSHYKAILEFLFEDKLLIGFRTYWPNTSVSEFTRTTTKGVRGLNLVFAKDESIDFMVGLYASRPGSFSPLVEAGSDPRYARSSNGLAIHWPDDLKGYDLRKIKG